MLVEGLPPDGAVARAAAGHHWGHTEFMLADLVDLMARLRVDFGNANRAEKAPPTPYPEPVWRPEKPGAKKKRKKKAARQAAQDRTWYQGLVAKVTPQYAEKG